jgi:hypothetical protein
MEGVSEAFVASNRAFSMASERGSDGGLKSGSRNTEEVDSGFKGGSMNPARYLG